MSTTTLMIITQETGLSLVFMFIGFAFFFALILYTFWTPKEKNF